MLIKVWLNYYLSEIYLLARVQFALARRSHFPFLILFNIELSKLITLSQDFQKFF